LRLETGVKPVSGDKEAGPPRESDRVIVLKRELITVEGRVLNPEQVMEGEKGGIMARPITFP
jgi:hypothetical protein